MRTKCLLALGAALVAVAAPNAAAEEKAKLDPAKLVGTWNYVSGEEDGKKADPERLKKGTVEITKDTISLKSDDATFVLKYSVDNGKSPCQIALEIVKGPQGEGAKAVGIVALKGDSLLLCYPAMGGQAPTTFAAKAGSGLHLFVLKRKK